MTHAFALLDLGSVGEGLALVERAWETADRLDHRILCMRTVSIRGVFGIWLYEPLVLARWNERELAKPRLAHVPIQRHMLQGHLAWAYALSGRLTEARRILDEAGGLPFGLSFGPPLGLWEGDWERAEADLRQWRDRHREMGNRFDEAALDGWIARTCRLRGHPEGAGESVQEALAIALPAHHRMFEIHFRIDSTLLDVERGRLEGAREHLERVRQLMAGDWDWRGVTGRLALAEGAVWAAEGDLAPAEAAFRTAAEVFRRQAVPWEEAETLLLWGRALGRSGEPERAGERLDAALAVYDQCGAGRRWQERVERERATL